MKKKELNWTLFNITGIVKSLLRTQLSWAGICLAQHSGFNQNLLKNLTWKALVSALILFGASKIEAQVLIWTTSQKQAIELLKSQGKLLPNVPTDFQHYGTRRHTGEFKEYIYNFYPSGDWWKYEANNLKNVKTLNGIKNIEIDNDVDSCNFLNETVYKANLDKIIPIIIDTQIDTLWAAPGEYERVDRANSRSFIDWSPNKETLTTKTWTWFKFGTHMNAMADVMIAKKDNYTEENYLYSSGIPWSSWGEQQFGRLAVGVWPGKARLYVISLAWGWTAYNHVALDNIYNEAKINPDKKYIISCSWVWVSEATLNGFTKLWDLPNVIIFVGRQFWGMQEDDTYAHHPNTIEVWLVNEPDMSVNSHLFINNGIGTLNADVSFTGDHQDWVVPMDSPQTGKMKWDGFCILGQNATSQSTAFLSAMTANIRAQNPSWNRNEILAILKRDTYKPLPGKIPVYPVIGYNEYSYPIYWDNPTFVEVQYDSHDWNEWFGYGVVQPWKTMKENIFPEIKESLTKNDGKYYLTVNNWPSTYRITWGIVEKDEQGYFIDVPKQAPGTYRIVFEGDCDYEGKTYPFPIDRLVTITNPTGSTEMAQAQTLVYPNPAGIQLFIEASEPLKTIELRTLSGQVVSQQTSNQQTSISVSLAGLNNGVYLLRIGYQNGKTSLYKIVKTGSP